MLSVRIIPVMLVRGESLVKGRCFDSWRTVGIAAQAARLHASRQVDELCILDVSATNECRPPCFGLVDRLSENCFSPISVGGGIRTVEDVRNLLSAGADKAIIGTAAHENPRLLSEITNKVGSQAICVAIDVKAGTVWTHSGTKNTGIDPLTYAVLAEKNGAGEILLTSIDLDGTMKGYDLDLIGKISHALHIPVIASGGGGTYEDFHKAILAGADAVAGGAIFQFSDCTPKGAAEYLQRKGIEVRL